MWQQQIIDHFVELGGIFPVLIAIGIDGGEKTAFLPDEFASRDALAGQQSCCFAAERLARDVGAKRV